jgi:hypothetical protein
MINDKEYELLRDLAKLLKKYGPEAFEAVAKIYSSQDFNQKFASILMANATIGRKSVSNRKSSAIELAKIKESEPKKYEIITLFVEEFKAGRILPSLKDAKRFVAENNLPEIKAEYRLKAISQLTGSLLKLSQEELEKLFNELSKQGKSDSSLSQWSDIITKGMSRSHRPLQTSTQKKHLSQN